MLMGISVLNETLWFPPVEEADADGLLAVGGDLSVARLELAYRSGIFPWYNEEEPPLWWSPNPRFVLYVDELKVSKSMQQVLRSGKFSFSMNKCFAEVIGHCQKTARPGQDGTWITDEVAAGYIKMHQAGWAVSAEAWCDGVLAGGLYGIRMGRMFFGESMFSHVSNASKFAFVRLVQELQAAGVVLIDCQVYTAHLESLGARMISRAAFVKHIEELVPKA